MDEYLVPIEQLKKKCDPSLFKGDTTEELPASRELIGQGRAMEAPKDWCYVFNFKRPKYPKAIGMKPGQGRIFKNEVKQAIRNIGLEIPKILTSKEYENNRNLLYTNHQKMPKRLLMN